MSSFGKTGMKRRSTERDNYEEEGCGLYLSNTIYIYYNISIYHPPSMPTLSPGWLSHDPIT